MGIYLFVLGLSGQGAVLFAAKAWLNRTFPGYFAFFLVQISLLLWIVCYIAEQVVPGDSPFWFLLKYGPVALVVPSWLLFTLLYTQFWSRVPWWFWGVFLWASVVVPVALTTSQTHLFFTQIVKETEYRGVRGPLYSFHLAWNYLLFGLSVLVLLRYRTKVPGRKKTAVILILASLIPWMANAVNELSSVLSERPWLPINPTLPGFMVSTLLFGWAVFGRSLLDPRPLARDKVFNHLPDSLIVVDADGIAVDVNDSARRLFAVSGGILGRRLDETETPLKTLMRSNRLGNEQQEPWQISWHLGRESFDVTSTSLRDTNGLRSGWLLTLRRNTDPKSLLKMAELGLSKREQELVEWVRQGLSNKEIALLLQIEISTVKNHLYNIYRKCGAGSRNELLRILRQQD